MELIKRNTGYGLRALLHMAAHRDVEAFTAEELAEAADTSTDFMHKIMRSLRDAGIVSARRGPSGGFSFERDPDTVTLLEVVDAVQGPFNVNRCVIGLGVCPRSGSCRLRPTWLRIQDELEAGLSAQTIGEIAASICDEHTVDH
ncbi:MAG: RrF2 family transcriptional regulator [Armatimonadota bacterium]|jgi:Rrf2 family iron-sulfur cluster assembly transcriptional regulator